MAMITAMSTRGQIVLPKKVRTALKLDAGTQFIVFSDNDNILLKPIKEPKLSGHCTMLNVTPGDAVRLLGKEYLQTLHVHDNDGKNDLHRVPYTGVIDWDDFQKALQEIGFDSCLSIETVPPKKFTGEMRLLQERSLYLSACKLAGR